MRHELPDQKRIISYGWNGEAYPRTLRVGMSDGAVKQYRQEADP